MALHGEVCAYLLSPRWLLVKISDTTSKVFTGFSTCRYQCSPAAVCKRHVRGRMYCKPEANVFLWLVDDAELRIDPCTLCCIIIVVGKRAEMISCSWKKYLFR
jgi:hypothetical protein